MKNSKFYTEIPILIVIFLAVNFIFSKVDFRIDLTEDKLYTLSPSTEKIVEGITEPVNIKFYYSSSHPQAPVQIKSFGTNVLTLLEEYENLNKDNIVLEIIDPQPDSEDEDWAQKYGLQGLENFDPFHKFYLGVVMLKGDSKSILPFLNPGDESLLEYNLTGALYKVVTPGNTKLGLMTGLNLAGGPSPATGQQTSAQYFYSELSDNNQLTELGPDVHEIPADISTLLLIHPKDLTEKGNYAIDQFLARGGKLMVLTDPLLYADKEHISQNRTPSSSNPEKLFSNWGIKMDDNVIGDRLNPSTIRSGQGNLAFPFWIQFNKDGINNDIQFMDGIQNILFPMPGGFEFNEKENLTYTSLIKTSGKTATQAPFTFLYSSDPADMMNSAKDSEKEYEIAGLLTGKFSPLYETRPDFGEQELNFTQEHLSESKADSSVMIVSDVDFLFNEYTLQMFGNTVLGFRNANINMFFNMVDYLKGSSDLISIRTRNNFARTFEVIDELQSNAELEYKQQEQALQAKLQSISSEITRLSGENNTGGEIVINEEVIKQIEQYRQDEFQLKQDLKEIRKYLRQDIDNLIALMKGINMVPVPLFLTLFGIWVYWRRSQRQ